MLARRHGDDFVLIAALAEGVWPACRGTQVRMRSAAVDVKRGKVNAQEKFDRRNRWTSPRRAGGVFAGEGNAYLDALDTISPASR